jgi:hypothetical protein
VPLQEELPVPEARVPELMEGPAFSNRTFSLQTLRVDRVVADPEVQSRVAVNQRAVQRYADAYRAGATLPEIVVFFDGSAYRLADGFHRHAALVAAGIGEVRARVYEGSRDAAMMWAAGASALEGQHRTNADKRKAVATIARLRPDWPDLRIAKYLGFVSDKTVKKYRDPAPPGAEEAEETASADAPNKPQQAETRELVNPDIVWTTPQSLVRALHQINDEDFATWAHQIERRVERAELAARLRALLQIIERADLEPADALSGPTAQEVTL